MPADENHPHCMILLPYFTVGLVCCVNLLLVLIDFCSNPNLKEIRPGQIRVTFWAVYLFSCRPLCRVQVEI